MILLLVILALICIWGFKFSGYHSDYLDPRYTTAIKGFFTVLIFCSHIRGYIHLSDHWSNTLYNTVFDYLGQLIVAMFFFFSGYGIWESWKRKAGYAQSFFKKRILKVLLHFDLAVLLFIIVQSILSIYYTKTDYLYCWVGWTSVGNSNWFIFVILGLYLIAQLGLLIQDKMGHGGILLSILLSTLFWIWLRIVKEQPAWWVDTLATFSLGMIISQFKPILDTWFTKRAHQFLAIAVSAIVFFAAYKMFKIDIYGGVSCLFCCFTVLLSSIVKIGNPILTWLGKNAFTIYIIQRLPMIVFSHWGFNQTPAVFVLASLIATLILAECLSRLYSWTDTKLFAHA